jgi:hypothetical protein
MHYMHAGVLNGVLAAAALYSSALVLLLRLRPLQLIIPFQAARLCQGGRISEPQVADPQFKVPGPYAASDPQTPEKVGNTFSDSRLNTSRQRQGSSTGSCPSEYAGEVAQIRAAAADVDLQQVPWLRDVYGYLTSVSMSSCAARTAKFDIWRNSTQQSELNCGNGICRSEMNDMGTSGILLRRVSRAKPAASVSSGVTAAVQDGKLQLHLGTTPWLPARALVSLAVNYQRSTGWVFRSLWHLQQFQAFLQARHGSVHKCSSVATDYVAAPSTATNSARARLDANNAVSTAAPSLLFASKTTDAHVTQYTTYGASCSAVVLSRLLRRLLKRCLRCHLRRMVRLALAGPYSMGTAVYHIYPV